MNTDRVTVFQGSALDVLRSLPSKSVDMILTDPPYSERVHSNLGKERRNDNHPERDALTFPPMTSELIGELAEQFVRVCRGWILVFCDDRSLCSWGHGIEGAGGRWVRTGAWVKTNPMPQMSGDRPSAGVELIMIGHAGGKLAWQGGGHAATWRGPRDRDSEHPNQKPLWLVQSLLGMFAPTGGLVLDPFLGSGTTAVAALAPDRMLGEVCVETTCKPCATKLAAKYQPPLPSNLRVLGSDYDQRWVDHSIARITSLLGA